MDPKHLDDRLAGPALHQRRTRIAIAMLIVACLFWGLSFPLMQVGPRAYDQILARNLSPPPAMVTSRAAFNTIRYTLAALLYILVTLPHHRGYSRADIRGGLVVGFFSGGGMFCQLVGLQYTTPSISAFITALSVVFAPIIQALVLRRPVAGLTWIGIVLAAMGVTMLAWAGADADPATRPLTLSPPIPYLGEAITLLGTCMFTGQILAVDHYGRSAHPIRLTALMIALTAGVNLVGGIVLGAHTALRPAVFVDMVRHPQFLASMLALVVLCSLLALDLMNRFQPRVSPATATVIYCIEPVFGTGFSVIFGTEDLTLKMALAAAVVFVAVLLATRTPPTSHEVHHP